MLSCILSFNKKAADHSHICYKFYFYFFSYSYILRLSKNEDMSDPETHECSKPPLLVDTITPGIIYYAAVALKDSTGYLSPWSQPIRLEKSIGKRIILFTPIWFALLFQCVNAWNDCR